MTATSEHLRRRRNANVAFATTAFELAQSAAPISAVRAAMALALQRCRAADDQAYQAYHLALAAEAVTKAPASTAAILEADLAAGRDSADGTFRRAVMAAVATAATVEDFAAAVHAADSTWQETMRALY